MKHCSVLLEIFVHPWALGGCCLLRQQLFKDVQLFGLLGPQHEVWRANRVLAEDLLPSLEIALVQRAKLRPAAVLHHSAVPLLLEIPLMEEVLAAVEHFSALSPLLLLDFDLSHLSAYVGRYLVQRRRQ